MDDIYKSYFQRIFFYVDHFLKFWLNLLQYCFCFLCFGFWPWGMWDLRSLTRDWTHTPHFGRWIIEPPGKSCMWVIKKVNPRSSHHIEKRIFFLFLFASIWDDECWIKLCTSFYDSFKSNHYDVHLKFIHFCMSIISQ